MSGQTFKISLSPNPLTASDTQAWQGASGNIYALRVVSVERFVLGDFHAYLLANAGQAIWVGTARDVIDDQISRSQFRRAISKATSAFELDMPRDEHQRLLLLADLETGHPVRQLSAA
ncbi:MAG TPA: hypothetical protein ENJ90_04250 [Devosia sp.]|nr:hypothetical protein [Devosia sp.]